MANLETDIKNKIPKKIIKNKKKKEKKIKLLKYFGMRNAMTVLYCESQVG